MQVRINRIGSFDVVKKLAEVMQLMETDFKNMVFYKGKVLITTQPSAEMWF